MHGMEENEVRGSDLLWGGSRRNRGSSSRNVDGSSRNHDGSSRIMPAVDATVTGRQLH